MKKLISFIRNIFLSFFSLLMVYGLFLLLSDIEGLFVGVILLLVCFFLFSIRFIEILKGRRATFLKARIQPNLIITIVITFATVFLSISNYALETSLPNSLTSRVKNQFYLEAILVEKDRIFERVSFLKTLENVNEESATVFYEPQDEKFAGSAIRHIRKMQSYHNEWIDVHQALPVTLILYRNPLIFQQHLPFHSYENLQALYVPAQETIHLLVTDEMDENPDKFLELVGHEYTHHWIVSYLFENKLDNRHLPRWFEEGIAEYAGKQSVREVPIFVPLNFIPFTRLHSVDEWAYENRRKSTHRPYRQSYYAIDQLVKDGNQAKIKSLLLNKQQNFYRMFEKETGESLIEFEVRFLREEFMNMKR
ncbi:hypothetical protein IHV12_07070 [Fictibacillus sp. 7GRE50]|uniref:hypothetical protein n=1 Tax=Fictibacillus sp. 7GRE50 TaxID=2745878 RepID=UPI0018CE1DD9|nr:hypothetical protein [Fictibacillus sp. 7GRE50]MBH0164671.1 hypothetical protein [Fictibacillus sp. 7GRE50]